MANETKHPRILNRADSVPELTYGYSEANSQTFVPGNLVYVSAAATLTECGSDATAIAGIAHRAASNVTSGNLEIPFQIIKEDDLISIEVSGSTTLSFDSATYYSLVLTSSVFYLDSTDSGTGSTAKHCLLPLYYIKDSAGDNTTRVVCRIRAEVLDFGATVVT